MLFDFQSSCSSQAFPSELVGKSRWKIETLFKFRGLVQTFPSRFWKSGKWKSLNCWNKFKSSAKRTIIYYFFHFEIGNVFLSENLIWSLPTRMKHLYGWCVLEQFSDKEILCIFNKEFEWGEPSDWYHSSKLFVTNNSRNIISLIIFFPICWFLWIYFQFAFSLFLTAEKKKSI